MPVGDESWCSRSWDLDYREVPFQWIRLSMLWDEPPENALQGRVLSEHELRVQRSLQRLNVPDWYKNSSRPAEGFLLKRGSDAGGGTGTVAGRRTAGGWPGLGVKTTSLSSLGSAPASSLRSPTTGSRLGSSPSPPPAPFARWSSSRLHSAGATPSTSPCGSARSSFNHRQPYLGWRSQERLSCPRTPAERLAQGLLPQVKAQQEQQRQQQQRQQEQQQLQHSQVQASPNLSEVRTSIKEVTSAIVHYVSSKGSGNDVRLSTGAGSGSPQASPRGSTSRLCWVESSFVGSRPVDPAQTPAELPSSAVTASGPPAPQPQQDLYLDLQKRGAHHSHAEPAAPDEINFTHHDNNNEPSEHSLKRTPSKRGTAHIRKRNRRSRKNNKKGSKTWKTKSKLKSVPFEIFYGIGVCML